MSSEMSIEYLHSVLNRYNTTPVLLLPISPAYQAVTPLLTQWANKFLLGIDISGSNAKGTSVAGVADLDLFVSLHSSVLNYHDLATIYNKLAQYMREAGYTVRRQNVSVRINHLGTEIDIVPGVKFEGNTHDHWLYVTKSGRERTKTNVAIHIDRVANSGRTREIRLTKIWRELNNLDFPSIYLEETVLNALSGYGFEKIDANFLQVLDHISAYFVNSRVVDPANGANILSEDLTDQEKRLISAAARYSRSRATWGEILR